MFRGLMTRFTPERRHKEVIAFIIVNQIRPSECIDSLTERSDD